MSYFPDSLMPVRVKQESADVDGNQFIVGGSDLNRHNDEIRAIESVIGFSGICSFAGALQGISQKLEDIRDNFIFTTSGVINCLASPFGIITFPSSWDIVLLNDFIADDSIADEEVLPSIPFVALSDVSQMPLEGYITIINDVSFADSNLTNQLSSSNILKNIIIPTTVIGKVGQPFFYATIPATPFNVVGTLPNGVSRQDARSLSGTPTVAGTTSIALNFGSGTTASLTIIISDANTPKITNTNLSVSTAAGSTFTYNITTSGNPSQILVTSLPAGLELFGATIQGTPTTAGTTSVVITVIDEFGGFDQQALSITVTGNVAGSPAPTISSITPTLVQALGGTNITITGTGFLSSPRVFIGTLGYYTEATVVEFVSSTTINVTTPALQLVERPSPTSQFDALSRLDLVVQNTDLQTAISSEALDITQQANSIIEAAEYTSLLVSDDPIYGVSGATQGFARQSRVFGLGTNVEILFYSGLDIPNNRILNVYRKQLGTTSTRHAPLDLVFVGIASFQTSPFAIQSDGSSIADISCVLRSNGKIEMHTRKTNEINSDDSSQSVVGFSGNINFIDNAIEGYASYQATLVKNIGPLPIPDC